MSTTMPSMVSVQESSASSSSSRVGTRRPVIPGRWLRRAPRRQLSRQPRDGPRALANLAQALKPGGTMLLIGAVTDSFPQTHPEVRVLWSAFLQAWRRFGTFDASNQHERLLSALGFDILEQTRRYYEQDSNTPAGRKHLTLHIETLRSLRRLVVDLSKIMDGAGHDQRFERLREGAAKLTGAMQFVHTVARKR